jgi:hypothetical protein
MARAMASPIHDLPPTTTTFGADFNTERRRASDTLAARTAAIEGDNNWLKFQPKTLIG